MKTFNYDIDLMTQGQINKEVLFNEAQLKMDLLSEPSVISFTDNLPSKAIVGEKHILKTNDAKNNYIVYCTDLAKGWQLLAPKPGMIKFVCKNNTFVVFQNNAWQKLSPESAAASMVPAVTSTAPLNLVSEKEKFFGIEGEYILPESASHLYLYINGDCTIDFKAIKSREFTIILKQNYARTFNIVWSYNVLWENKVAPKVTQVANAIDVIKFYRMVETQHFLGQMIGQNYQF